MFVGSRPLQTGITQCEAASVFHGFTLCHSDSMFGFRLKGSSTNTDLFSFLRMFAKLSES